jgi:hypothetical protein
MTKFLKSIGDCNTIMILIILLSILLLAIIWYKKQRYEYFENKEPELAKLSTEIKLENGTDFYKYENAYPDNQLEFIKEQIVSSNLDYNPDTFKDAVKQALDECANNKECDIVLIGYDKNKKSLVYVLRKLSSDINKNKVFVFNDPNYISAETYIKKSDLHKPQIDEKKPIEQLSSNLTGKCANITLKSKDIGKDCFGQLWAENKCDGAIPEYNDDFKALSYEEITKELKDSSCYTNEEWKKTSYRFARAEALKPITKTTEQTTQSTQIAETETEKPKLAEPKKMVETEKSQLQLLTKPIKELDMTDKMTFYEKSKYILKTMLIPDNGAMPYNKEDSIKATNNMNKDRTNNTVGISLYELQAN